MKKIFIIVLSILTITSLFLIIPIQAEEPAKSGAQTLIENLSAEERQKIIDVAFAEHKLNVLRLSPTTVSYVGIIYTTSSSGSDGHSYYHLILGGNSRSFSGISQTSITTSFHINSTSTMYHYVWSDLPNGGWVFSNTLESGVLDYECTSVLFYRTVCGSSGKDYNLSQNESTQLSGSGTLGACAQSWIDCYNVKLNGLPASGKYTQEEYDQHGQNQYLIGQLDYQKQILADPSILNLYDADDLATEKELSRQEGISHVCLFPEDYDLYTKDQYDNSFNDGYESGYQSGLETGYDLGVQDGQQFSEPDPAQLAAEYQRGLSDGVGSANALSSFVSSLFTMVISGVKTALDVQIWGLQLSSIVIGLAVLAFVALVWSLIRKYSGG